MLAPLLRKAPRVLMQMADAGDLPDGKKGARFECPKCGGDSGWVYATDTKARRGTPCTICNPELSRMTQTTDAALVPKVDVDCRLHRWRIRAEHVCGSLQQPRSPLVDRVRVHVILLRQLSQRLLAVHGSQCHLGLERRTVVPAWSLAYLASCSRPQGPMSDRQSTYPRCANFPSHLCAFAMPVFGQRERTSQIGSALASHP